MPQRVSVPIPTSWMHTYDRAPAVLHDFKEEYDALDRIRINTIQELGEAHVMTLEEKERHETNRYAMQRQPQVNELRATVIERDNEIARIQAELRSMHQPQVALVPAIRAELAAMARVL